MTAYRTPYRAPDQYVPPPPRCACWEHLFWRHFFALYAYSLPMEGFSHTEYCRSYQRRYPEMKTPIRRLRFSWSRPFFSWEVVDWHWSDEAITLNRRGKKDYEI